MSNARVTAYLGMEIGSFGAALDKANGMLAAFKRGFKSGGMGSLGNLLGAGAIIQGFRAVLQHTQDARREAKELGTTMDAGTASVAAYADRWDMAKEAVVGFGVQFLSVFTRIGRAMGEAMGTGSSDAEVTGINQNEEDQKQREKDNKANGERIDRERKSAKQELDTLTRNNRMADLPDKERALAIDKEINALWEKRNKLIPGSLEELKTGIEIEKKMAEARDVQSRIKREQPVDPSAMKARGAFGMTVGDVAKMRPVGRRSERERLAGEVMALEERGKTAESAGRFELAASYRDRAKGMARRIGFGDTENKVGPMLRGRAMTADPDSWDARYGAQLAARDAKMTASYGGAYKRPDINGNTSSGKSEAGALTQAAAALTAAAEQLKTVEVTVDAN